MFKRNLTGTTDPLFQNREVSRNNLLSLADLAPTTFYKVLFRLAACKKMTDDDILPALRLLHSLTDHLGAFDFFFRSPDSAEMFLVLLFVKGEDQIRPDASDQQWRRKVLGKELLLTEMTAAIRGASEQSDHGMISTFMAKFAPGLFALLKSKVRSPSRSK